MKEVSSFFFQQLRRASIADFTTSLNFLNILFVGFVNVIIIVSGKEGREREKESYLRASWRGVRHCYKREE